ncbi:MAG: sensory box protein [Chthoniobacteraceae bacterium]|nr:sensory box protein [Chthoniobacteraceae bacterium]
MPPSVSLSERLRPKIVLPSFNMAQIGGKMPVDTDELEVPFTRVAKFVRQLSHDVRNHLGSMDLQSAYIAELITDPEAASELKKLRSMISVAAKSIQTISSHFWLPQAHPLTLSVEIFFQDFQDRLTKLFPEESTRLKWDVEISSEVVSVDIEMMFTALSEFCRNAFYFSEAGQPIGARVRCEDESFVIELREKRAAIDAPVETWGSTPLVTTRRGGFGLGLFHARQMLAAHGAHVEFDHNPDAGILTTRVMLPLVSENEHGG